VLRGTSPGPRGESDRFDGVRSPWLLVALAAVATGCGGPAAAPYDGPRGPETFYACALFPASEARAELPGLDIGQASGPLDASSGTKYARCAYGYGPQAIAVASLEIRRHPDPTVLRRKLEASLPLLKRLTQNDVAAVPGLGDVAYWAGAELRLLKIGWRDLELLVTVAPTVAPGGDPGFNRAAAERIGRRALARLAGEPVPDELQIGPRSVTLGEPPPDQP
jgi:hypothetical protein